VLNEWWGASPSASAATNTPPIQAALRAAFGERGELPHQRLGQLDLTTASGGFSVVTNINDEIKAYHVVGFEGRASENSIPDSGRRLPTSESLMATA